MLNVQGLEAGYGKIDILQNVNLTVCEGEIVSILGANGAGKTTLLRALSGLNAAKKGKILFQDKDITQLPDYKRVEAGLIHVPEGRGIIKDLTVMENLELGAFRWRKDKNLVARKIKESFELFPRLSERKQHKGGALSGGEQQMLAIARGVMARPKLLMLDEPSLGISPIITKEVFRTILNLRNQKISILLVEQNVRAALQVSDRVYVLSHGKIVKEGTAAELTTDTDIQEMYMGA